MEESLNSNNTVEARDAETVLKDENASVEELMTVIEGDTDEQLENTTVTTGTNFYDGLGIKTGDIELGLLITAGVSLVLALIIFFSITIKKKSPRSKFLRWFREFLNFRKVWIAGILKFVYLFLATLLTIGSIVMMFFGGEHALQMILICLLVLVFGNILLRIGFEMTMITIGIWENTRDIRGILVRSEEASESVETEEELEDEPDDEPEKGKKRKTIVVE